MLTRFMDEVMVNGADAVLPHNLADEWIGPMLRAGAKFLRHAATVGHEEAAENPVDLFEDMDGSIFIAAVTELLQSRYDYPAHFQIENIPDATLYESISCYALYAILEAFHRKDGLSYPKPDADSLLEPETIAMMEAEHPEISAALHALFQEQAHPDSNASA